MEIQVRSYREADLSAAVEIWNQVVEEGVAFPQTEKLTEADGREFFAEQSYTGVACDTASGSVVGLYILHPNNIGRCGHICNTSYAVHKTLRGQRIGEALVRDSLRMGKELGFKILQFNAVVRSNVYALRLYRKMGFVQLGSIPAGFLMKDGHYEDIIPHYHAL
ncbi:MAG: GNAT family N-acetyltransferase [Lachnospiraceae bacterium]|nr:GNAT family N-acetyltransferase [Lachnospiraceae bacterium]